MENEIVVNGTTYIKKETLTNGKKYQIFRTYSAGVFAGYCESIETKEGTTKAVLRQARRLWSWAGAASLSELATKGTSKPTDCKFPCEVDRVELTQVIEILDVTEEAKLNISKVKVWTSH